MICATCRREVVEDGVLGYLHADDHTMVGEDGHSVIGVQAPRE